MDLGMILTILIAVVIFIVAWKIVKSAVKALFFVGAILALFIVVVGAVVLADAKSFQNEFAEEKVLFLLVEKQSVIAGAEFNNAIGEVTPSTSEQLVTFSENFAQEDWDALLEERYKVITMESSLLEGVPEEEIEKATEGVFTKAKALDMIHSDDPYSILITILYPDEPAETHDQLVVLLDETYGSPEELKGIMFHYYVGGFFRPGGVQELVAGLKSEEIVVHPETPMFIFLRKVPFSLVKSAASSLREKSENTLTGAVVAIKEKVKNV